MKTEKTQLLKIKLKGKDATTLIDAVSKIVEKSKVIGFAEKPFNEDEVKLFDKLNESFKSKERN